MIIHENLASRQQQLRGSNVYFLWADCYILNEINYCISNRVGSNIESPLDSLETEKIMIFSKLNVSWLNLSGWL